MGGIDSNGSANVQRGETPFRCTHVASEATRDVVGLGNPIERFLASTGRGTRTLINSLEPHSAPLRTS